MKIFYLIVISTLVACGGDTATNNNNNGTTQKPDVTEDMGMDDVGDNNNDAGCVKFDPANTPQEECKSSYTCEMVDDTCGGTVEECKCECPEGDSCGVDELGTCGANECEYIFDGFGEVLSSANNIVYVREGGAGGDGTKSNPFGSYGNGITVAGKGDVVLMSGTFNEQIIVKNGTHIIGGWDEDWKPQSNTQIHPDLLALDPTLPSSPLIIRAINDETLIYGLDIVAPDSDILSSYGAFVFDSTVVFRNLNVQGGIGADGTHGIEGVKGADGQDAQPVIPAINALPRDVAVNPSCLTETEGGQGGKGLGDASNGMGGNYTPTPNTAGFVGSQGFNGGGRGGRKEDMAIPVGDGEDSIFILDNGADGAAGGGGGNASATGWMPTGKGGDGVDGDHGRGGGGGGGTVNQQWFMGSAGGGGGAGGCGGTGGDGGEVGHGSFGLFAFNANIKMFDSKFEASIGGKGGDGGTGGRAGLGGEGANGIRTRCNFFVLLPDSECADFVDNFTFGKSGDGGDGSKGGAGGNGAAGNGGDSYGGFCEGSTMEINNSSFVKGGRATGGAPSGGFGVASVQEGCE